MPLDIVCLQLQEQKKRDNHFPYIIDHTSRYSVS